MLSEKAVQEFKELYLRRYGVELSDAEARQQAGNLLSLYRVLLTPDGSPEEEEI
jgi:hypothetical protein